MVPSRDNGYSSLDPLTASTRRASDSSVIGPLCFECFFPASRGLLWSHWQLVCPWSINLQIQPIWDLLRYLSRIEGVCMLLPCAPFYTQRGGAPPLRMISVARLPSNFHPVFDSKKGQPLIRVGKLRPGERFLDCGWVQSSLISFCKRGNSCLMVCPAVNSEVQHPTSNVFSMTHFWCLCSVYQKALSSKCPVLFIFVTNRLSRASFWFIVEGRFL